MNFVRQRSVAFEHIVTELEYNLQFKAWQIGVMAWGSIILLIFDKLLIIVFQYFIINIKFFILFNYLFLITVIQVFKKNININ